MVAQIGKIYPNFNPRYYQSNATDAVFNYFRNKKGNPVVAMPTGSGKSWVIAMVIYDAFMQWPNQRCAVATHDSELVKQDLEKLLHIWPTCPVGVYSASLNRSEYGYPITFGTIKSMSNAIERALSEGKPNPFGYLNFFIVDEAQYFGEKEGAAYNFVVSELLKINPDMSVIGLSATPFRMRMGKITENGIFTDFCYDITRAEDFVRLVKEGFLCPLYSPAQIPQLVSADGIKLLAGEYNQAQAQSLIDRDDVSYPALETVAQYGQNRGAWLLFAGSIAHSENLAGMLQSMGINAAAVHSKNKYNDEILKDYRAGKVRCVVNNNKLTVGFDYPGIDLIGVLRLTNSPGLWGQMLGRGARTCETKRDCLCLDFVGNTERLGPINDLVMPEPPGSRKKSLSGAIVKICPECKNRNSPRARECLMCGHEFPETTPDFEPVSKKEVVAGLTPEQPVIETFNVSKVFYNKNQSLRSKQGFYKTPPSMKVSYVCENRTIDEYVCFEHTGYARKFAEKWWLDRHNAPCPMTTDEALRYISSLKKPKMISVRTDKQFPEIKGVIW